MRRLFVLLIFSTILTACGGGSSDDNGSGDNVINDNNNDGNNNDGNNNDDNVGQTSDIADHTWRLCNKFSATSTRFSYIFTKTGYVYTYDTYLNNSCSGTPHTASEITSGTYTLGGAVATSGGFNATEIDFLVSAAVGAPLPSADQYTLYDIYYVDNDALYFGTARPENAAGRTNTIDFSDAFIRD